MDNHHKKSALSIQKGVEQPHSGKQKVINTKGKSNAVGTTTFTGNPLLLII